MMRKESFLVGVFFLSLWPFFSHTAQLEGIDFWQRNEITGLEFSFDTNDVQTRKFNVREDRQIIVDFRNTKAQAKILRGLDTSEFSGAVVFVSAYPKASSPGDIRVVVQLRDNVRSMIQKEGNKVVLRVENRFGVFEQDNNIVADMTTETPTDVSGQGKKDLTIRVPRSDSLEDILENITLSGPKQYVGKKISLDLRDLPFEDTIKIIAETSGFNIVLTQEAKASQPVTLTVINTPWDQILNMILELNELVAERDGSILTIHSFAKLAAQRKAEADAKKQLVDIGPLETRVIPLSYAKTDELMATLTPYLTEGKGAIKDDKRTNSLIVKDTSEVIDRIRAMIEVLDTQVPQILIESKIVEINEDYRKAIGLGTTGINFTYDGGSGATTGPEFTFSSTGGGAESSFISGFTIGRLKSISQLVFDLQLMESESKGKIIASPKVITQNNQAATITSTEQTSFSVTSSDGGVQERSYEQVSATLNMSVIPKVTNDGFIGLTVNISKSSFGARPSEEAPPDTTQRSVNTNVLVASGSTVVIGGLYTYSKATLDAGIPLLKDIPLIGWLFRTAHAPQTTKSEMMIFLTPRIINQEEAKLVDSV